MSHFLTSYYLNTVLLANSNVPPLYCNLLSSFEIRVDMYASYTQVLGCQLISIYILDTIEQGRAAV